MSNFFVHYENDSSCLYENKLIFLKNIAGNYEVTEP